MITTVIWRPNMYIVYILCGLVMDKLIIRNVTLIIVLSGISISVVNTMDAP